MNQIEQMFYDAYVAHDNAWRADKHIPLVTPDKLPLKPQYKIAGYIVDFLYEEKIDNTKDLFLRVAVEIDGQESHKTKAQRLDDYQRERFLQKNGIHVVRFTASEVYVDAESCVCELEQIAHTLISKINNIIDYGMKLEDEVLKDVGLLKEKKG
jgi:very-short-patch-repair endonuclease